MYKFKTYDKTVTKKQDDDYLFALTRMKIGIFCSILALSPWPPLAMQETNNNSERASKLNQRYNTNVTFWLMECIVNKKLSYEIFALALKLIQTLNLDSDINNFSEQNQTVDNELIYQYFHRIPQEVHCRRLSIQVPLLSF